MLKIDNLILVFTPLSPGLEAGGSLACCGSATWDISILGGFCPGEVSALGRSLSWPHGPPASPGAKPVTPGPITGHFLARAPPGFHESSLGRLHHRLRPSQGLHAPLCPGQRVSDLPWRRRLEQEDHSPGAWGASREESQLGLRVLPGDGEEAQGLKRPVSAPCPPGILA